MEGMRFLRNMFGMIFIILLMLGWASGCRAQPIDISLLTDDPCAAPCWHNIIPGVSDEEDVRTQLERSPFVKEGTLFRSVDERGVHFVWKSTAGPWNRWFREAENWLWLRDDKVVWIDLFVEYSLSLGEVVEKYGSPEGVSISWHTADFIALRVSLYYPRRGILFSVFEFLDEGGIERMKRGVALVSEDMKVNRVRYFVPDSIEGEQYMRIQEWRGFGEYKAKKAE